MGYSSRYHAASLAAVLVALAVGILIGAALGSDIVSGTAENLEQDLGQDLDRLRAENAELRDDLDFERSFEEQVYPAIVGGRLPGQSIALVALGEADTSALKGDVEAALEGTGAELTAVASVSEPPNADRLSELLVKRPERGRSRDESLRLAARRAGGLLVDGGEDPGDALGTLLSGFSGEAGGIRGVALARAPLDETTPREARETEILEEGLISGMLGAGVHVVGVERSDDEDSSIEYFAGRGLPTVDNIDRLPGKVALVLAMDGADGSFGGKDTADSLLPELIDPAPGTRSGSR